MAQLSQTSASENWKPRFSSMSQKSKIVFDFFPIIFRCDGGWQTKDRANFGRGMILFFPALWLNKAHKANNDDDEISVWCRDRNSNELPRRNRLFNIIIIKNKWDMIPLHWSAKHSNQRWKSIGQYFCWSVCQSVYWSLWLSACLLVCLSVS